MATISPEKKLTNTNPCAVDTVGFFVEPVEASPLLISTKPCACMMSDPLGQKDKPSSCEDLLGYGAQVPVPVVFEP